LASFAGLARSTSHVALEIGCCHEGAHAIAIIIKRKSTYLTSPAPLAFRPATSRPRSSISVAKEPKKKAPGGVIVVNLPSCRRKPRIRTPSKAMPTI
jgi:hypothetical protein